VVDYLGRKERVKGYIDQTKILVKLAREIEDSHPAFAADLYEIAARLLEQIADLKRRPSN